MSATRSFLLVSWAILALAIAVPANAAGMFSWAEPTSGGKVATAYTETEVSGYGQHTEVQHGDGRSTSGTVVGTTRSCLSYDTGTRWCNQGSVQVGGSRASGGDTGATWKSSGVHAGARFGEKVEGVPADPGSPWKWAKKEYGVGPQAQVGSGSWKTRDGNASGTFDSHGVGVAGDLSFEGCGGDPKKDGCTFKDKAGATIIAFPWRSEGTPGLAGGGNVAHLWRWFRTKDGMEIYVGPTVGAWAQQGAKPTTPIGIRVEASGPHGGYGGVTAGWSPQNGGAWPVSVDFSTGPMNRQTVAGYHCNVGGAGTNAIADYKAGKTGCLPPGTMTANTGTAKPVAVATVKPAKSYRTWREVRESYAGWKDNPAIQESLARIAKKKAPTPSPTPTPRRDPSPVPPPKMAEGDPALRAERFTSVFTHHFERFY